MVMLSEQQIARVVGELVVLAWQRTPNYHSDLVETLIKIVRAQDEGFSDRLRKERVKRIIEGLGIRVLAQEQESQ